MSQVEEANEPGREGIRGGGEVAREGANQGEEAREPGSE